jgi:hypothetical protein
MNTGTLTAGLKPKRPHPLGEAHLNQTQREFSAEVVGGQERLGRVDDGVQLPHLQRQQVALVPDLHADRGQQLAQGVLLLLLLLLLLLRLLLLGVASAWGGRGDAGPGERK